MKVGKVIRQNCHNKTLIFTGIVIVIIRYILIIGLSSILSNIVADIENNSLNIKETLYIAVPLLLCFLAVTFLSTYSYNMTYAKTSRDIDAFSTSNILRLKPKYFKDHSVGEILRLNKVTTKEVALFYMDFYFQTIADGISLLAMIGVLFYYNYIITIILIICIVILYLLISKISIYAAQFAAIYGKESALINGETNQLINNHKIITMLKTEEFFVKRYSNMVDEKTYKYFRKYLYYQNLYVVMTNFLTYILPFIVLIFGLLLKDYLLISTGIVLAMYTIVGNIQEPVRILSKISGRYKENKENEKLIADLILATAEVKNYTLEEFNNLSFNSKGITFMDKHILDNVNFEINKGDFVLLKGESGSGKSTILKYIMQEEKDDNISILVNGKSANNYDYNNIILTVTQENYLFNDTILQNITLGQTYKEEELNEIYKVCELEDFIKHYTINKVIDNADSNISGGEKQRICLARILIKKPKLLLIDEITASLDKATSEIIAKNIYDYARKYNITILSISHKNEFDKYANKEVVIG